jgi:hypothetical protein
VRLVRLFAVACGRCLWERSALGRDGGALLRIGLRAHYVVAHRDAAEPTEMPVEQPAPTQRRVVPAPRAVAPVP